MNLNNVKIKSRFIKLRMKGKSILTWMEFLNS